MSGGHFDYYQYHIDIIADSIEQKIQNNNDDSKNEYGDPVGRGYSKKTIEAFKKAVMQLKRAAIFAQRVDWLLSGDDGEDDFHQRLAEELKALESKQ